MRSSLARSARSISTQHQHSDLAARIRQCGQLRDLEEGKRLHDLVLESGSKPLDGVLSNLLVEMYGKCGQIEQAFQVFQGMSDPSVFSWTMMIAAFARNGHLREALWMFRNMDLEGVSPNNVTFVTILGACTCLEECRRIHSRASALGYDEDTVLGTALLNTYGKFGCLEAARSVFENLGSFRNVVSWTVFIAAYAQNGYVEEAFELYRTMQLKPNKVTFIVLLDACADRESLSRGKQIHADIVASGLKTDVVLETCLLNMYGKCGSVEAARSVFDEMEDRTQVTWNAMIAAYARNEHSKDCLQLYSEMLMEGTQPDEVTYLSVLEACSLSQTTRFHMLIAELGLDSGINMKNALLSSYARCGSLADAKSVFDGMESRNCISWNAMISALARHEHDMEAVECFRRMDLEGVKPNSVTFLGVLTACGRLKNLNLGKQLCRRILKQGRIQETMLGNAVINMYARFEKLDEATDAFQRMDKLDVVSWNTLIAAYAQQGRELEALKLFRNMDLEGYSPDKPTFLAALEACGSIPELALGRLIHSCIVSTGLDDDSALGSALVTMYSKCGSLSDAKSVFWKIGLRSLVSWTTLIATCAQHGREAEALLLFWEMQLEGMKPDGVTFSTLIAACSRKGLVKDGLFYFLSMVEDHEVAATYEHYGGVIDLLGRAGWLQEAEELLHRASLPDSTLACSTLLGACELHGDVERGIRAANDTLMLEPKSSISYIALSNMYRSEHLKRNTPGKVVDGNAIR